MCSDYLSYIVALSPTFVSMENSHIKIMSPQVGFQEKFVSSNVDFVIGGGVLNCGKTFGALLMGAEPSLDANFTAVYLRNNMGDLKAGGGIIQECKALFGNYVNIVESGEAHIDFPSGARWDFTHLSEQSVPKVLQRFKGRQYDLEYFDEGTGYEWGAFKAVYSRNRGKGLWTGKVRMTTNPKKSHWIRTFIDWYIGDDGYIMPEREGIVRYFWITGETVDDVIWGDTKEEVYAQGKIGIDKQLDKANGKGGKFTYHNLIKSFTFYLGSMSENTASIGNNPDYIGSVAMLGGREAEAQLEGNWNVDPEENVDAPISPANAKLICAKDNSPLINDERWITADIADYGTDNTVILVWYGLHVVDITILTKSTGKQNVDAILLKATEHLIADSHIIYDATNARYISDYISDSIPFLSSNSPRGLYSRMANRLKDECYLRLVKMIENGMITMNQHVANKNYPHTSANGIISYILASVELIEECSVVSFVKMPNGKMRLATKHEMNKLLGKGRSMDLLDPFAMRMLPLLEYEYGKEFDMSTELYYYEQDEQINGESIYDITQD